MRFSVLCLGVFTFFGLSWLGGEAHALESQEARASAHQNITEEIGAFDFKVAKPTQGRNARDAALARRKLKRKVVIKKTGPNDEDHFAEREIESVMNEQKRSELVEKRKARESASLEKEFWSSTRKHKMARQKQKSAAKSHIESKASLLGSHN